MSMVPILRGAGLTALLSLGVALAADPLQTKGTCTVDPVVTTTLNVYGEIRNPFNTPITARGTLIARDGSGRVVQHKVGLPPFTVINPGERYPVFQYGPVSGRVATCVLEYTGNTTARGRRGSVSGLNVAYQNLAGFQSAQVSATVRNTEGVAVPGGILNVTGYDARGQVVMVASQSVTRLEPGERRDVKFMALNILAKPVSFSTLLDLGQVGP